MSPTRGPGAAALAALLASLLLGGCASQQATDEERAAARARSQEVLTALPESPAYRLQPGDRIEIASLRREELDLSVQLDPGGSFQYPYVGTVHAAGMTIDELGRELQQRLQQWYRSPRLTINLLEGGSQYIYVLGEVRQPGRIALDRPMNLLEAIAAAGGHTYDAELENVYLIRTSTTPAAAAAVDLEAIFEDGEPVPAWLAGAALHPGDIVEVPSSRIADVQRLFQRIQSIVRPVVDIERGIILLPDVGDVLTGNYSRGDRTIIVTPN